MPGMCWRSSSSGAIADLDLMEDGRPRPSLCTLQRRRAGTPVLHLLSSCLLGGAVAVQHFLRVVVFYAGLVAENLVVPGLEQLLATVAELGADGLLHPWVG